MRSRAALPTRATPSRPSGGRAEIRRWTSLPPWIPDLLLGCHWVHRGAGGAGEGLGRGFQEEGVDAVVGAVGGEGLEVPVLSLGEADVAEVQEVDREEQVRALAGEDLEGEVVGGDGGDVVVSEPWDGVDAGTRRRVAVRVLVAGVEDLDLASAHEDHIARFDIDLGQFTRCFEVVA